MIQIKVQLTMICLEECNQIGIYKSCEFQNFVQCIYALICYTLMHVCVIEGEKRKCTYVRVLVFTIYAINCFQIKHKPEKRSEEH